MKHLVGVVALSVLLVSVKLSSSDSTEDEDMAFLMESLKVTGTPGMVEPNPSHPATPPPVTPTPATETPASRPPPTLVPVPPGSQVTGTSVPQPQPPTQSGDPNAKLVCGKRNPYGISHRNFEDSDSETLFGEFPWMVAVLRVTQVQGRPSKDYHCAGTLIHPSVVLTVAHCYPRKFPAHQLVVKAGVWDVRIDGLLPPQDRNVSAIAKHENFNSGTMRNNIALLFLTSPFELNQAITPICLPPPGTSFDQKRCIISGWGHIDANANYRYQSVLKQVDLPIVPSDTCQAALRTTRMGPKFKLEESVICAGGEAGKSAHRGDGGSPLVCPIDGFEESYYLAGTVLWSPEVDKAGIPGMYANVALLRGWIDEKMLNQGLTVSGYSP